MFSNISIILFVLAVNICSTGVLSRITYVVGSHRCCIFQLLVQVSNSAYLLTNARNHACPDYNQHVKSLLLKNSDHDSLLIEQTGRSQCRMTKIK